MNGTLSPSMAKKKKPKPAEVAPPAPKPAKDVLYLEMDASLKRRLVRLAELRVRKITAEGILAIRRYVEEEEKKEGLPPIEQEGQA